MLLAALFKHAATETHFGLDVQSSYRLNETLKSNPRICPSICHCKASEWKFLGHPHESIIPLYGFVCLTVFYSPTGFEVEEQALE